MSFRGNKSSCSICQKDFPRVKLHPTHKGAGPLPASQPGKCSLLVETSRSHLLIDFSSWLRNPFLPQRVQTEVPITAFQTPHVTLVNRGSVPGHPSGWAWLRFHSFHGSISRPLSGGKWNLLSPFPWSDKANTRSDSLSRPSALMGQHQYLSGDYGTKTPLPTAGRACGESHLEGAISFLLVPSDRFLFRAFQIHYPRLKSLLFLFLITSRNNSR